MIGSYTKLVTGSSYGDIVFPEYFEHIYNMLLSKLVLFITGHTHITAV